MRTMTFWLFELQSVNLPGWDGTVPGLCAALREMTPPRWATGLCVKAHHGDRWQASTDQHPLAISGPEALIALRDLVVSCGVSFGTWGEPQVGAEDGGGTLAGQAAAIAGSYVADVEPYSDFSIPHLPMADEAAVAAFATRFWAAYRAAGGDLREAGVSLVPLPSGLDPFGRDGLWAWVSPVRYVQPQCYYDGQPLLHPDRALPYLRQQLRAAGLKHAQRTVPIFTRGTYREQAARCHRWRYGLDVWRV